MKTKLMLEEERLEVGDQLGGEWWGQCWGRRDGPWSLTVGGK